LQTFKCGDIAIITYGPLKGEIVIIKEYYNVTLGFYMISMLKNENVLLSHPSSLAPTQLTRIEKELWNLNKVT
jgi:hypothetical protein